MPQMFKTIKVLFMCKAGWYNKLGEVLSCLYMNIFAACTGRQGLKWWIMFTDICPWINSTNIPESMAMQNLLYSNLFSENMRW